MCLYLSYLERRNALNLKHIFNRLENTDEGGLGPLFSNIFLRVNLTQKILLNPIKKLIVRMNIWCCCYIWIASLFLHLRQKISTDIYSSIFFKCILYTWLTRNRDKDGSSVFAVRILSQNSELATVPPLGILDPKAGKTLRRLNL